MFLGLSELASLDDSGNKEAFSRKGASHVFNIINPLYHSIWLSRNLRHLGDVYFKRTQYEKSLEMYQKALSLNHDDKDKLKQKIEETTKFLE